MFKDENYEDEKGDIENVEEVDLNGDSTAERIDQLSNGGGGGDGFNGFDSSIGGDGGDGFVSDSIRGSDGGGLYLKLKESKLYKKCNLSKNRL